MTYLSNISLSFMVLFSLTAVNIALEQNLPEGEGQEAVQTSCSACHGVKRISNSLGYSREHWLMLMDTMVDLSGDS